MGYDTEIPGQPRHAEGALVRFVKGIKDGAIITLTAGLEPETRQKILHPKSETYTAGTIVGMFGTIATSVGIVYLI